MIRPLAKSAHPACLAAILLALLLCLSIQAQVPGPAVPQLTDAQAQALLQAAQSGVPLTAAQTQVLTQYMLQKSKSAAVLSNVTAAQSQAAQAQMAAGYPGQSGVAPATTPALLSQSSGAAALPVPGAPPALGEKKPGVVRIGIVMPKAQLGQGSQGPTVGEPLRGIFSQYLSGPSVETTAIAALLPQQIEAEAQAKQCDYLIYSTFTQKKSAGGMGFLKGASTMSSMIPMIGGARAITGAMAASSAATAAQAASLSSSVKAKNDVVMEYQLTSTGNASPVLNNTLSAKAKVDGEDVITPLIEQSATAIMAEITKKK